MEKVRVVKPIPGILKVGDVLISPVVGEDFCVAETEVTQKGSNERYVSLDYVTVSENVPQYFEFIMDEDELELDEPDMNFSVSRTNEDILKRKEFFEQQFADAFPGSEPQIVYQNLIWFIDWLTGKVNLI